MPEDDPLDAVAEALQGCIGFFSVSYAEGFLEALEDEGYTVVRKEANG